MAESIVRDKSFAFALRVIALYRTMAEQHEYVLSRQLLRCGTSIGANIEEALAGQSSKDFTAKMSIASKEARETRYWLKLLSESHLVNIAVTNEMHDIEELIRLLTSIVKTSSQKDNKLRTQNSKLKTQVRAAESNDD